MDQTQMIEVPIAGMDCAECTQTVQRAITSLNGIRKADVFLSSEKAIIQLDPSLVKMTDIRNAVKNAGYSIPGQEEKEITPNVALGIFSRRIFTVLGLAFGAIILLVVAGEWLVAGLTSSSQALGAARPGLALPCF
jgi:Cd2+/Zn2+-exporting ATPase/Cu+-exporting ATPase